MEKIDFPESQKSQSFYKTLELIDKRYGRNPINIGEEFTESQEIRRTLENPTIDDKFVEIQTLKSRGSKKELMKAVI